MTQAEIKIVKKIREEIKVADQDLEELEKILGPLMKKRDELKSSLTEKNVLLEHFQNRCEESGHTPLRGGTSFVHMWEGEREDGYECDICGKKVVRQVLISGSGLNRLGK